MTHRNDTPEYSIRLTTSKGEFWWTGWFRVNDATTGFPPTHTFGWGMEPKSAQRWKTVRGAIAFAQRIDGDLRLIFAVERVQVVEVRYSPARGWVACDEYEPVASPTPASLLEVQR